MELAGLRGEVSLHLAEKRKILRAGQERRRTCLLPEKEMMFDFRLEKWDNCFLLAKKKGHRGGKRESPKSKTSP